MQRALGAIAALVAIAFAYGAGPTAALPISSTPSPPPTPEPTETPIAATLPTLPEESRLVFVLDGTISSRSMSNSEIPAHLRDALVVDGRTLAPAGAPELIKIENSRAAQAPDVDGSVEIYFEPLKLTDGRTLPLRTPIAHIDHHLTTGQADTQEITDTLEDIFIPYHYMWRILARKGQDVNLGPGTQVRASTAATIRVDRNGVSIVTPPPLKLNDDVPKAAFSPNPFYTVPPTHAPPAPRRTQSPATPPPSDSPSPEASSIP